VEWLFEPAVGGSMVSPLVPPLLEDVNDWKQVVKFPDLDAIDWKSARERDEKLIDRNKLLVITILNGPFERLHALME
jgi:uroporphyrinogen decarboxylase